MQGVLADKRARLAALKEARAMRKTSLSQARTLPNDINALVDSLLATRPASSRLPDPPSEKEKTVAPALSLSSQEYVLLDLQPAPYVEVYEKESQTTATDPPSPILARSYPANSASSSSLLGTIVEHEVPLWDNDDDHDLGPGAVPEASPGESRPTPCSVKQFSDSEVNDIMRGLSFFSF
ncbi:MAG: hypothetical protein SGCHY_004607 [Lobulomycetales sp.]